MGHYISSKVWIETLLSVFCYLVHSMYPVNILWYQWRINLRYRLYKCEKNNMIYTVCFIRAIK